MATLNELRVVLAGCGGMANAWINIALKIPQIKLVGLVDVRREAAEAKAAKFNLPPEMVYPNLRRAIKKTQANVVFDVTVPAAHHQVALTAFKYGCHVLGEKPMSDTLARARKMVAAAEKAGVSYGVTQTRRPNLGAISAAAFIDSGQLGGVEEIHSDFYIGAHFGGFRDEMDEVLLVDMAIHTFDQARQIGGCDPVSVYCQSWNPPHSWYKGNASACAIFQMKTRDGRPLIYTYRGSWCNEGLQTSWNGDWRITGPKGTIRWDGEQSIKASLIKPGGEHKFNSEMLEMEVPHVQWPYGGHEMMLRNFVEHLMQGTALICPCQDNIKSLAMVLAAVQSAKKGRPVPVVW